MDNLVYHYTSLDALRGILEKKICLWATEYNHLNDPSEQLWAEEYVIKLIKQIEDYQNDSDQRIVDWLRKEAYIISLCKNRDDRNMWRLYCNDGRGVCLILDKEVLLKSCQEQMSQDYDNSFCIIEDIEYSSKENISNAIAKNREKASFNILDGEEKASVLMRVVPFIKNEDFAIEAETRCAILRDFEQIRMTYDETTGGARQDKVLKNRKDVKYRMRGNELVPYIEMKFPTTVLKGIILGYELDVKKAKEYISNLLKNNGSSNEELDIIPSNLFSSKNQRDYNSRIKERE